MKQLDYRDTMAPYLDSIEGSRRPDLPLYLKELESRETVLVVQCATGSLMEGLLKASHPCIGLDSSEAMVSLARSRLSAWLHSSGCKVVHHDLSLATLPGPATFGILPDFAINTLGKKPDVLLANLKHSLFLRHKIMIDCLVPGGINEAGDSDLVLEGSFPHHGRRLAYRDHYHLHRGTQKLSREILLPTGSLRLESQRQYLDPRQLADILGHLGYREIYFTPDFQDAWTDEPQAINPRQRFMVLASH